jgi:N-acetylmuramoyl-L-alanine amidase
MTRVSLQHRVTRLDNAKHHGGLRSKPVTGIVMHDTVGGSARSSIDYMNSTADKEASYHYLIDRNGDILRMTPTNLVAFHAGDSRWPNPIRATAERPKPHGGQSVNGFTVGIAFASKDEPPTDAQMESALWLCAVVMASYPKITVENVFGHYECSPGRKTDPVPNDMPAFRARLAEYLAA